MKRIVPLLLVGLCVCYAFAAANEQLPIQHKQAFSIVDKSTSHMDIRFTLPEFEIEEVAIGESVFHRIIMTGAGSTLDSGYPELPTLSISVAIPRQGSVNVEALSYQQNLLTQFHAYPVQQGQELESPKSFVIDSDYYQSGGSYPTAQIEYSDPMILRDFRIINIQVNPFSYNAVNQELTLNSSIDFRLNYTSTPGINELEGELTSVSPAFSNIYESIILNYDDYRNLMYANTPPRYLIIYGNNTDPNFITAMNEFVLWKRQKGADVDLASTAANEAGSSTTSIKNYIQAAYNNPATRPDYVILIGDTSGSYTIPTYTVGGGVGDYPYTHLAGNDGLGDVFIGRISAENLSQLQLLFAKIYLVERDVNLDTAQWLNRMLLVGDWAPSGISTVYTNKYIKERALFINPDYTFTEIYGDQPSPTLMNQALNQGVGFFSYRGYLGMSGWSPSESSLFNAFRLSHAIILTCSTGNFGGTATTESFIRLGTVAVPKGAVTAIGMATSSTHTTFNNALHGGIWGGLLQYNMRTIGEALLNGRLYIHQIYGVSSPTNAVNFAHWCNLMGDPTMEAFTGIPNHFNVTVQSTIPLGLSLLDVAVQDSLNLPVSGASVTLTQNSSIISRGYTDEEGNLILVLPSGMTINDCTLTISKHEFKPLQQVIEVDNSGTLIPGIIVIDDDNTGPSNGNDDGLVNAGETVEVLFGLINTSSSTISGISGYVTTNSPWVTFADSLITYPAINATELGFNLNPVVMQIAPEAPHEAMIRIHLILTDSQGNSYDISEFVPIYNAKILYHSYLVIGGNQALDPGETARLNITLSNIGAMGLSDVYGKLYTLNDLVAVTDNIGYYGDMLQNIQVTPTGDNFELFARPQVLPGMLIPMQLKLYNDTGFVQWVDFTLTIGVVTVNDPLGPDTYGYVIYDDQDTGYDLCPVYDWVGIAPAEGGVGTLLAITDAYNSSNEGDQVGSDALEVVTLPFPFQFYGIMYSQITVSSNGFIAFGVTENAEFRNYRLPGPMGPNPMIAAFWDDLATGTGSGIYTWFDRNNHAFVIEWYNMKNGYNGSTPETFQIILYDQSVHATSLGDGPIKIQYHTFNNINAQSGNRHGNFCTIGIEDHTGMVGLEYTFNNQYPTAASPLGNQRAIYITNIPVHHESAHVILGETYVDDHSGNGNGVCEPGETVDLGIQLNNIGNALAENISATLSTDSGYISILNAVSDYYPIPGEGYGYNRTPFTFHITPNCPNGEVINFSLDIEAGEYAWTRPFSLRVDASVLEYHSYLIDDSGSNFNGIIDPLETVQLVLNIRNISVVRAENVVATLSTANAEVLISSPILVQPAIEPNHV